MYIVKQSEMYYQPIFIKLHPNKYGQEFQYYPFAVQLDRCVRSCNTLNGLSNTSSVPNKPEDLHVSVLNMITWINELKTLTKHTLCECKSNTWWKKM